MASISSISMGQTLVIFSESFENPSVNSFDDSSDHSSGWIGSSQGFGATNRGLFNEILAWSDTPDFSTPFGEQACLSNYSNSGLTTSRGAISGVLTQDVTYTISFNAAVEVGVTCRPLR